MDNMKHRRLQELDRSDFSIVEGEPDIRGWDVKNTSGQKVGEVEELILDALQRKVRYMVVELDDNDLDLEDGKRVLIPVGLTKLDKEEDNVIMPSIKVEQLKALPAYDADALDDETERVICLALGREDEVINRPGQEETPSNRKRNAIIIDDTTANAEPPAIGTPEYYASFYQHPYFNGENLSQNPSQQDRPQQAENETEYERGLRLWELRSKGGVIANDTSHNGEISNDRQREMIRDRRAAYEQRQKYRKGKSIIDRINDEGLQDA